MNAQVYRILKALSACLSLGFASAVSVQAARYEMPATDRKWTDLSALPWKFVGGNTLAGAEAAKGIDYDSLDGQPVRIIVTIAAPDNDQNTYLRVLAAVMHVLRDEDKRKAILGATSPADVIDKFK
jgi:hypothetical protein